ncbi:MAG TPA: exosortase family protein XrtF [Bacteroidia bacterium]|jgi:exosortase family protein XrtF|nr:exosortase family protein XrtF [Bacteroidia bacterium]
MKLALPGNPLVRFLLLFILLYTIWYVFYQLVVNPNGRLDSMVINSSVACTAAFLKFLGYTVFTTHSETIRTVGIDGTHGLWIGDPCDGITLFALFTAFIIAFPGPLKHKIWYIPSGIVAIFVINVLRITGLCLVVLYKPNWLDINHDYIFKVLVYGFIFSLWMIWINRFSNLRLPGDTK